MNTPTSKTISLHEKLSSSESLLFFLGIIFFTEAFLAFNFEMTISGASLEWYKNNVSSIDVILYFASFSIFYGAVLPFLLFSLNLYLVSKLDNKLSKFEGYVKLSTIKSDAFILSNSALYKHYENITVKIREAENARKLALAVFVLLITVLISYFNFGSEEAVLSTFWQNITKDGFLWGCIRVTLFCYSFWLLGILFNYESEDTYAERIDNYERCHESRWLSEVSTGVLKLDELLHCLSEIKNSYEYDDFEIKHNFNNQFQKYCKVHGLISIEDQNVKLTGKGVFFEKYLIKANEN